MTDPIDNGGKTDKYTWQQTAYDVTIIFPLQVKSSKDVHITLTPSKCTVKVKNEVVHDNHFTETIKAESSCWYIDEDKNIVIEADKFKKHSWWKSAFTGDDEIDTTKVTPASESYADLDSSTKSTISKMLYEQELKEQNKVSV